MKLISDIIKECVEALRLTETVTGIVESSGTYTVSATDISTLAVNDYVEFANTDNFTGEYQVTAIDTTLNTFSFVSTAGITIATLGTWTALNPYFYNGQWFENASNLAEKNLTASKQGQKYPLVYLEENYTFTDNADLLEYDGNGINVYFIKETDINQDSQTKIDNTISSIRTIKDNFLKQLRLHQNIIGDFEVTTKELPFAGQAIQAEDTTEMIEISIPELLIYNNELLTC